MHGHLSRQAQRRARAKKRKAILASDSILLGRIKTAKLLKPLMRALHLVRAITNAKMIEKLKSRKFWAAVTGTLFVSFGDNLGIDAEAVRWAAGIVMSYIIGQSGVDAVGAKQ